MSGTARELARNELWSLITLAVNGSTPTERHAMATVDALVAAAHAPPQGENVPCLNAALLHVIRDLLATLPKCAECEHPATRMMLRLAPEQWYGGTAFYTMTLGGNVQTRGPRWVGSSAVDGKVRETWEVCEEHEICDCESSRPMPTRELILRAQALLEGAK